MTRIFEITKSDRMAYTGRWLYRPVFIFFGLSLSYLVLSYLALSLPSALAAPIALLSGFNIAMLFVVGHDACHQSYTSSKIANNIIGRLAFLPSLHPFSLWDLGHNKIHHRFNNIKGKDFVWAPLSPAEFSSAGRLTRLKYRFFRSPFGVPFYYGLEIWAKSYFFALHTGIGAKKKIYFLDIALVWMFFVAQVLLAWTVGTSYGKGFIEATVLAIAVPFGIWNILMSTVIYLHHNHPEVPWYRNVEEWRRNQGAIAGTVHVQFNKMAQRLFFFIMEHNAHHLMPSVPLYKLRALQSSISEHGVISWDWSFKGYLDICRECKLYDFSSSRWVTFPEGKS